MITACALAKATLDSGDIPTAISRYQKIIKEHPQHSQAYVGLSDAFWEDGNASEAIDLARYATKIKPQDAVIKAHLATILASVGDIETANTLNRQALEVNPNCIPALLNLAQNLRGKLPETDARKIEQLLDAKWTKEGAEASLNFGLARKSDRFLVIR